MTPDERDARLTAYALDDPGLTPTERDEIMQRVVADPAARRAVEETRAVATLLTAGLAAELAAQPAGPVTVPSTLAPKPRRTVRTLAVMGGVAALAVAGLAVMIPNVQKVRESAARSPEAIAMAMDRAKDAATNKNARAEISVPAETPPLGRAGQPGQGAKLGALRPTDLVVPSGEVATAAGKANADSGKPQPGDGSPAQQGMAAASPERAPTPSAKEAELRALGQATALGSASVQALPRGAAPDIRPGLASGPVPVARAVDGRRGEGRPGPSSADAARREVEALLKKVKEGEMPGGSGGVPGDGKPRNHAFVGRLRAPGPPPPPAGDRFPALVENDFVPVAGQAALSTFGVDVDTASYSIVRNHLVNGQLPPPDAVRLEEIVNYFPYQDKGPDGDDPFAVTVEVAACPWQPAHRLARIGLKAKTIAADKRPPSNLVFLIDVSGSMAPANRLPLVKASMKLLVGQLGENDRVGMVVYAGTTGLVLDSTSAVNKGRILEALDRLEAGGSTNGAGGLQQAYDVAAANFIKGGTNRVILCTDGDWNVGTTSTEALVQMVEDKRKTGVYLSVFGFGMGNLRDEMLVKLAGKGNGNYGYIDTIQEAKKALVEQLSGTLVTVAKDVKIQVEFNPAAVQSYRLLGYEKRLLAAEDFHDDKKDAGEMGAGHVVTALYELVPAGEPAAPAAVDRLRYQPDPAAAPAPAVKVEKAHEAFVVKMRHKKPDGDTSTLRELPVSNVSKPYQQASDDFRFSAAAASFAMLLRNSPHKGTGTFATAADLAGGATTFDPSGYRAEFAELVRKARQLSGRP